MKFLINHRFYIIVISLLTLILGVTFLVTTEEIDNSFAERTHYLAHQIDAYWVNPKDSENDVEGVENFKRGNYINTDGDSLGVSLGSISANITGNCSPGNSNRYEFTCSEILDETVDTLDTDGYLLYFKARAWGTSAISYNITFSEAETSLETGSNYYRSHVYSQKSYSSSFDKNDGSNVSISRTSYVCCTPKELSIILNADGGLFSNGTETDTTSSYFLERYYNTTYGAGTDLSNNIPTKTGHYFVLWYYLGTNSSIPINQNTVFSDTSKNVLTAAWSQERYNITFNPNGGTLSGSSSAQLQTLYYGSSFPTPTRTGYSFAGWNTNINGNGTNYTGTVPDFGGNEATITLYAKWTPRIYRVNIDPVGGSVVDLNGWTNDSSIYKNITFDFSYGTLPTLSKDGYNFINYTYNGYVITSSTIMNTASDHTITANWEDITYYLTFDANGGAFDSGFDTKFPTNPLPLRYTESYRLPSLVENVSRQGYIFEGWSLTNNGSVDYLDNASVSMLTTEDQETVTLYAVWRETWAKYAEIPAGSGSKASPFIIDSPQTLAWMANQSQVKSLSGYFIQTTHINLSGKIWLPIGNMQFPFIGIYDGQGYSISNINTLSERDDYSDYLYSNVGLFGYASNATMKNINLIKGSICGDSAVGGIAGNIENSTIEGCTTSNLNISGYSQLGGIAGEVLSSIISNSYSKTDLIGEFRIGGIAGRIKTGSQIISCGFEGYLISGNGSLRLIATCIAEGEENYIIDCFANVDFDANFCNFGANVELQNCLWVTSSGKFYYGTDFSNWVISTTNTPLPSGLSWMATAGEKVTSINQIKALGYTAR